MRCKSGALSWANVRCLYRGCGQNAILARRPEQQVSQGTSNLMGSARVSYVDGGTVLLGETHDIVAQ